MKKLLILTISLFIISCNQTEEVIIDGCQYFKTSSYNGNGVFIESLTHKGNCSNPIHKYMNPLLNNKKLTNE